MLSALPAAGGRSRSAVLGRDCRQPSERQVDDGEAGDPPPERERRARHSSADGWVPLLQVREGSGLSIRFIASSAPEEAWADVGSCLRNAKPGRLRMCQ